MMDLEHVKRSIRLPLAVGAKGQSSDIIPYTRDERSLLTSRADLVRDRVASNKPDTLPNVRYVEMDLNNLAPSAVAIHRLIEIPQFRIEGGKIRALSVAQDL